tara:strand:- start:676 stop:1086 length:411 start_codon:yes stop_codon:yes gene_type:complete
MYFVLFIIGLTVSVPQNQESELTLVYITFGVVMFLIIVSKTILSISSTTDTDNNKTNYVEIVNVLLPGLTKSDLNKNIGYFVLLLFVLYPIISLFRMIELEAEEAFSPIVFLGSYCFLQVINYMFINLSKARTKQQ